VNELTEESYPAFFERFRDFHDACIKSIQVYFRWGLGTSAGVLWKISTGRH